MRLAIALFLLLKILLPVYGLDPRKSLTQYSSTLWGQQHGLPQDTIRAIAQTPDGYLWVGTDEGLARFDGYEFVVYNQENNNLPGTRLQRSPLRRTDLCGSELPRGSHNFVTDNFDL